MQELLLTPQELLYCAAQMGTKRFFGIEDPFYAMDPEDIQRLIPKLEASLEQKGVAQRSFDDDLKLQPQAEKLIAVCAGCDAYLLVQSTLPHQAARTVLVYFRETETVSVTGKEQLCLRRIGNEELTALLKDTVPACTGPEKQEDGIRLAYSLLTRVQVLAVEDPLEGKKMLQQQGASEALAEVLLQGFGKGIARVTFCRCELRKRVLHTMVMLYGENAVVCMTPADVDEQIWDIRYVSSEEAGILAEQMGRGEESV